jgi:hypothetical protein
VRWRTKRRERSDRSDCGISPVIRREPPSDSEASQLSQPAQRGQPVQSPITWVTTISGTGTSVDEGSALAGKSKTPIMSWTG